MSRAARHLHRLALVAGFLMGMPAADAIAQDGPVSTMYGADQKRHQALAPSFVTADLPPSGTTAPVRVYLSAGDLERAFDTTAFRPDAAVVPTNTGLLLTAAEPGTQQVLVSRVRKHPQVLRDLEEQLAARRNASSSPAGGAGGLQIGIDTVVVRLPREASARPADAAFPGVACLIATDFAKGGALDQRELFAQGRLRQGIAACLSALDAAGATSLVLPLTGAASSEPQERDAFYEGQRVLKECRLINATAGIALGIHDFAASRRNLREIGVIQWDAEILQMFSAPEGRGLEQRAQQAYRSYADQIAQTFRRGLAGQPTTANDLQGSCAGVLNVP